MPVATSNLGPEWALRFEYDAFLSAVRRVPLCSSAALIGSAGVAEH